jgi:L-fuculose-phosphate aldolase
MERMRLSREIIETCLEMTSLGLNQGTAGNVSARYENGMLITPSGIPYERLTENMIVYVDNDGKYDKGQLPSSEWRFHLAAYQTRPDANAVVHNHAVHCTAVSILNRPIPAIHYMIAAAGELYSVCALCDVWYTRAVRACERRPEKP